ncbi:MAG: hypothetical protein WC150_12795 [Bacteroidia bacterium]
MQKLQIPSDFEIGFKDLVGIEESCFIEIESYIAKTPLGISPSNFILGLIEVNTSRISTNLANVIYSFGELLSKKYTSSITELAVELTNAYKKNAPTVNEKLLEERLIRIFSVSENLILSSKAIELLKENDNVYIDSRIITDIRLVFNNELTSKDKCALIIHNLRLNYLASGGEKEFYLSLDRTDLQKLKETIERAIKKEQHIIEDNLGKFKFIHIDE